MMVFPDGNCLCEQSATLGREAEKATPAIVRIDLHLHQAAPFQRLEGSCQSRAIYGQQICYLAHGSRFWPV